MNSSGHFFQIGRILVDIIEGKFLWTLSVNSHGHGNSSFGVSFHGHILGEFFSMVITNGLQRTLYSSTVSGQGVRGRSSCKDQQTLFSVRLG